MSDLLERALMADQLITGEALDESTSLPDENNDPPLTCWLTCENPQCFERGCALHQFNKGEKS